ncbi:MAG: hypothetical protein J7497_01195 [Chitinophagaceae bacterium]|nr:hypothetical protein [Chitinophagaceae bacterium]
MKIWLTILLLLSGFYSFTQVRVSGRVYDISKYNPLEAVSVLSTSGGFTVSDSLGRYSIVVNENDSIWFSYLNKPTPKYAVKAILNVQHFEISLHVNTTELKQVQVMPRNYRQDSIQNRLDYAKAFNFQKPGVSSSMSTDLNPTVGMDLDAFINMFRFKRNKRMLAFQDRLLQEEEDRFIDYRFSRALIIKLTGLHGEELNDFIQHYRPSVEFVRMATDYELQDYIKSSYRHYEYYKNMMKNLNQEK